MAGKPYKMKLANKAETSSIVAEVKNETRRVHWEDKASGEYYRINTHEMSGSGEYRKYTNINMGNKNTGYSAKYYAEEKYPEDSHRYIAEEKYPEDSAKYYAEEKYPEARYIGGNYSMYK